MGTTSSAGSPMTRSVRCRRGCLIPPVPTSTLGPPVIAIDALSALRELLDALRAVDGDDRASSLRSPREGVDEATDTAGTTRRVQLNLPLLQGPTYVMPDDQQAELVLALVALLIDAAHVGRQGRRR